MFAFIFISFIHAFLAVAAAAVVGGVLGYAFRGKESRAIQEADQYATKVVVPQIEKKL